MDNQQPPTTASVFFGLGLAALAIALLYFGREIFIPLSLAILLAFLLAPLVQRLEDRRIPRVPAVLLVALLTFSMIGGIGYVVGRQVYNLAVSLPQYETNIKQRVRSLRGQQPTALSEAAEVIEEIGKEMSEENGETEADGGDGQSSAAALDPSDRESIDEFFTSPADAFRVPSGDRQTPPIPVVVRPPPKTPIEFISGYVGPFLAPLATAAIVVIFVIFMLIQRDDLRDRILQLVGRSRIHVTTEALSDAGGRISRYLLMQFIINVTYGIPVGVGLWLIGLPGAVLWGLLATLLRFIPYVGPWAAASMPILLSLAVFTDWMHPLAVVGLFVVLELFSNNVMEPLLYGHSTGLSPMAVIVAMVFWGWIWGGIGLLLAVPMTVCFVVAGKYIPQMEFLAVLLGDRPTLAPHARFYQRLASRNEAEAIELAREYAHDRSRTQVYDELLMPALRLVEHERHRGWIDPDRQRAVRLAIVTLRRELSEEWARQEEEAAAKVAEGEDGQPPEACEVPVPPRRGAVACVPARDEADLFAAEMLCDVLTHGGWQAHAAPVPHQSGEPIEALEHPDVAVACISVMPTTSPAALAHRIDRIRNRRPDVSVIVALWHDDESFRHVRRRLRAAGAHAVVTTVAQAVREIDRLTPVEPVDASDEPDANKQDRRPLDAGPRSATPEPQAGLS